MILAFHLSMPNVASWDGRWSGDGKRYVIVKKFHGKKEIEKAEKILENRYHHYAWPDGWGAGISISEVDSKQAAKLRRDSQGFCGYNWMVKSICEYGKILADHEFKKHLESIES